MIVAQIKPQLVTENGTFKPDSLTWDKIYAAHIDRSLQGNSPPLRKRAESSPSPSFPSMSSSSSSSRSAATSVHEHPRSSAIQADGNWLRSAGRIHKVAFYNDTAQPVPLCRRLRGTPLPGTVREQGVGSSAASAGGKWRVSCTRVERKTRSQEASYKTDLSWSVQCVCCASRQFGHISMTLRACRQPACSPAERCFSISERVLLERNSGWQVSLSMCFECHSHGSGQQSHTFTCEVSRHKFHSVSNTDVPGLFVFVPRFIIFLS